MNPMAGRKFRELRAKLADEHYRKTIEDPTAMSSENAHFTKQSEVDDAVGNYDGLLLDGLTGATAAAFAKMKARELRELRARQEALRKEEIIFSERVEKLNKDREIAEMIAVGLLAAQANKADKNGGSAARVERRSQIRRHVARSLQELKNEVDLMHQTISEKDRMREHLEVTVRHLEQQIQAICESVGRASLDELLADQREFEIEQSRESFTETWLTNRLSYLELNLVDQGDENGEEDYRAESNLDEY
ncbi:hypothetical protein B0T14DRAFT_284332 [Immersiella caudata]|uniref:Uncharacterized protein n=1 Tax=Immersiella caudata TaxID=314043 RepID=A0AA39WE72_9PEZI|nr:hypothetical protein B0T14DRAFT_284332 [Immersiella caudata]